VVDVGAGPSFVAQRASRPLTARLANTRQERRHHLDGLHVVVCAGERRDLARVHHDDVGAARVDPAGVPGSGLLVLENDLALLGAAADDVLLDAVRRRQDDSRSQAGTDENPRTVHATARLDQRHHMTELIAGVVVATEDRLHVLGYRFVASTIAAATERQKSGESEYPSRA